MSNNLGRLQSSEYKKAEALWFKTVSKKDSTIYYGEIEYIRLDTFILHEGTPRQRVYTEIARLAIMANGDVFDIDRDNYYPNETAPILFKDGSGKNWRAESGLYKYYNEAAVSSKYAEELDIKVKMSFMDEPAINSEHF